MTLAEIENLSFADLKAKRDELITEAAKSAPGELAARYVQARTDAKMRDEKLVDQAATIKALQDGMGALQTKAATAEALAGKSADQCVTLANRADELANQIVALKSQLAAETTRANTAEKLAKDRRAALADVMGFAGQLGAKVSPLLAQE